MQGFADRTEGGRVLAGHLEQLRRRRDVVVLGLARGGVPVAYEAARRLHCPLDVFLVRKLGVPGREELAMGAIASRGVRVMNDDIVAALHIAPGVVEVTATRELRRIEQQEAIYRGDLPAVELTDRTVVVIDDGIATGATMAAAIAAVRVQGADHIVACAPVAAREARARLERIADDVVVALEPDEFHAVGEFYADFAQVGDDDVAALLQRHGLEAEHTPRYRPHVIDR